MSIKEDAELYEKAAIAAIYVKRNNPVKAIEALEAFSTQLFGEEPLSDSLSEDLRSAKNYAKVFGQPAVWNEYRNIAQLISIYASKYPLSLDDLEENIE